MKRLSFRKLLPFIIILAAVGFAGYGIAGPFVTRHAMKHTTYQEFYKNVEAGNVAKAVISSGSIEYTLKSAGENAAAGAASSIGGTGTKLLTENPKSPLLKEFLMRNGVSVQEETDAADIFSDILDYLFYIIFFGVFFVVFRKFISPNTFHVVHHTGVTFDNIVGMDALKRDMLQVIDIMKNPESYRKRGIRMPKGILLEGAPGNGKTLFARALAGEAKVNFIPAKATDFESMFMAIGPAKVKLLFHKARKRAPCIVFIDEFDGIGTRRNYSGSALETENTRIVTALLNELDGFTPNSGILVLAATNSIQALDEALIRPGRFDARFAVPYPDTEARVKLSEMYLCGKSPAGDCTPGVLGKMFSGFSCSKIESVINRAALIASQTGRQEFTLDDVRAAAKEQ